jgi:spermidine synthase
VAAQRRVQGRRCLKTLAARKFATMTDRESVPTAPQRQYLPILLLLFFGSGCAALIYEVVWFQLLELIIGSSAVSLGVLLGVFMGGMCLGSYLLPRFIGRGRHPLRVYAFLELGIAAMGLLLLFGMPLVNLIYGVIGGNLVVRALVAAICLLPPTLMMGATLPAIARWVETTPRGVSWLGFFYGGNIGGAVMGSLLAGFYLLRVFDMSVATYVAVLLNIVVAVMALTLARFSRYQAPTLQPAEAAPHSGSRVVHLTIALSGLTALSAEVIWTRLLSLICGATVYTFSLILAVFLAGLGIGSSVGSVVARRSKRPRLALGFCQLLLCGAFAWAAYMLCQSLPHWSIDLTKISLPSYGFRRDLLRALCVVLPGAMLWGASFPLALASVAAPGQDPARLVGGVYAANTIGAILGSLVTSLVLVATIGSRHAQQVLIVVSALSGLLVLAPLQKRIGRVWLAPILVLVVGTSTAFLVRGIPEVPDVLVAFGRYSVTFSNPINVIYKGEGLNAFVAVSQTPNGVRNYHNAGKIQASSEPYDMRLQRILGHLTHLIPRSPKRVLVIGCGAGVTAGALSIGPGVEHETIAEIEPLVPRSVGTWFKDHNYDVIHNPKVDVHIDDARHTLLTSKERFDGITSDPLDPWVKGAATLYTEEFFEIAKQHLNPGGVVTLFVQFYESSKAAVKSELATFFKVFPNGVVWGNTKDGAGYDVVLMGQVEPIQINIDEMEAKLASPEYAQVAQSLREVGLKSAVELFSTYAGQARDLRPWLSDAQINRDRNLRLQYLAGEAASLYQNVPIYSEMIRSARFPDNIFTGSEPLMQALREGIRRGTKH